MGSMTSQGVGRVYRPTRKCLKCDGEGCDACKDGRRQISVWHIQYSVRGRQYRESSRSRRRADAVKLLERRLAEKSSGRFLGPAAERVTFEELSEILLADYRMNARKSTKRVEQALVHLGERFAGERVVDITTASISRYIDERLSAGAAASTVRIETNALRRAFRLAHRARRVLDVPYFPTIRVENVREGFFEPEEFRRVHAGLPRDLQPLAEFGYLTGWRLGEILGLQWRNVDFSARVVRLDVGSTKSGEGRVLPFGTLPRLETLVRDQRERTDLKERRHERVIPWVFHRNGKRIRRLETSWRNACAQAGCPGRLFHDLRRSAVRNLERAGVPRSIAMRVTGHKTESVYRRYAIVSERDIAEGLGKLAALVGER